MANKVSPSQKSYGEQIIAFAKKLRRTKYRLRKKATANKVSPSQKSYGEQSRDDWIRTSDLYVPNVARYRAALHPEIKSEE